MIENLRQNDGSFIVMPAQAGIQTGVNSLDASLRWHDNKCSKPFQSPRTLQRCIVTLFATTTLLYGCFFDTNPNKNETFLEDGLMQQHLIAVGQSSEGVRIRGFSHSVPANANITFQVQSFAKKIQADDFGCFDAVLNTSSEYVEIQVETNNQKQTKRFQVKNMALALKKIIQKSWPAGQWPQDILLAPNPNDALLYIVSTGENAIHRIPLLNPTQAQSFKLSTPQFINPWSFVFHPSNSNLLFFSLYDSHNLASLHLQTTHSLSYFPPAEHPEINLQPPIALRSAQDVLFNGDLKNSLLKMKLRHPSGILAFNKWLLVAFDNYLEFATITENGAAGPGSIALFEIEEESLRFRHFIQNSACLNPKTITLDEENKPWVACAGIFGFDSLGKMTKSNKSALLKLNIDENNKSLNIMQTIDLENFSPTKPLFEADHIVIGNQLQGPIQIAVLPRNAQHLNDGNIYSLATNSSYVSSAVQIGGALMLLTDSSNDSLVVFDALNKEFFPWPFDRPILLEEGLSVTKHLPNMIVSYYPAKPGVDYHHPYDVVVSTALSSQIFGLSLLQLVGP